MCIKTCEAKRRTARKKIGWLHCYSWRTQYPFNKMDRSSRQRISKDIVVLKSTIHQLAIVDIYWLLPPTIVGYTLFSSSHGTFTKIDHILGHRTHLNILKRIEVIKCLLSGHSGIKLEVNKKIIKCTLHIYQDGLYSGTKCKSQ